MMAIIRINSQSGKGGIAYISARITASTCRATCRWSSARRSSGSPTRRASSFPRSVSDHFIQHYVSQPEWPPEIRDPSHLSGGTDHKGVRVVAPEITDGGEVKRIEGRGTGPDRWFHQRALDLSRHAAVGGRLFRAFAATRVECVGDRLCRTGSMQGPSCSALASIPTSWPPRWRRLFRPRTACWNSAWRRAEPDGAPCDPKRDPHAPRLSSCCTASAAAPRPGSRSWTACRRTSHHRLRSAGAWRIADG